MSHCSTHTYPTATRIHIPLQHAQIKSGLEGVLEAYNPVQHANPIATRIYIPCNTHVYSTATRIYIQLQHAQIQDVSEGVLKAYIPLQHAHQSHCNMHIYRTTTRID